MFIAINSKIFKILQSYSYDKWDSVSVTSMVFISDFFNEYFSLLTLMLAYWAIIQALAVGMFETQ